MVRTSKSAKNSNPLHKFFFLRPKANVDANAVAEKLISLRNVQEVIMTEGDVGYIVKTRLFSDKSDRETERLITRSVGGKLGTAVACSSFKK
jgi:hypothetical protein